MKKILVLSFVGFFAQAEVVEKIVQETPSVSLGLNLLNGVHNLLANGEANPDATDAVKKLKFCLGLALENAMTEDCKKQSEVVVSFSSIECRYSGAFSGPASCTLKVRGSQREHKTKGVEAHAILQSLLAADAGVEGAAGQRFLKVTSCELSFNPSMFEGGAGAKVTFKTENSN